ncbi:unnamed protein product [Gemmataceae bacterium]|nr:unnamed protein product [Gemmataceae bacterium]VTU00799.1 unnamed protein product [Gemmataceae bacterium]
MLQFFTTAMRAPARHLTFRRAAALHVLLVACLGWGAAHADTPERLAAVGQIALVLGVIEGASLVGWRLAQIPKSQALEFLLVSQLRPPGVFLAEALVGVGRFALVSLAGLPVLLVMVLQGLIIPADLWPLGFMPFLWGVVTALGLTVWAYEPVPVRRVGEVVALLGVLFYLVVGILAGEKLQLWISGLPPDVGEWVFNAVMRVFQENPFGVARNWFLLRDGPGPQWPGFVAVNLIGAAVGLVFAARAASRLKGHFHDRHYKPLESTRPDQSAGIGERPLSWWAVRRVMEYSGRVNVYLAGGFCLLYSAFIVAGDHWPDWMGRAPFLIFELWGGPPMVAASMCVLAAVPAAFQFGLWDPTVADRCKRLELLLLTDLSAGDYWHASRAAAWRRGRDYFWIACIVWVALAVSGRAHWYQSLAAAAGGVALWAFSFAVGFRAFSTGTQAGGTASMLTLGFPLLLFALLQADLEPVAAFVPTAACYLPVRSGITWAWAAGFATLIAATVVVARRGLAGCDANLRKWLDANQGRRAE